MLFSSVRVVTESSTTSTRFCAAGGRGADGDGGAGRRGRSAARTSAAAFRTQRDAPVGEDRRPRDAADPAEAGAQALDDDFLLGHQLVDDERHAPVARGDDQAGRLPPSAGAAGPGQAEHLGQRGDRQRRRPPGDQHLAAATEPGSSGSTRTSFSTLAPARANVWPPALHQQRAQRRQGQRHASVNRVPRPRSDATLIVPCTASTGS